MKTCIGKNILVHDLPHPVHSSSMLGFNLNVPLKKVRACECFLNWLSDVFIESGRSVTLLSLLSSVYDTIQFWLGGINNTAKFWLSRINDTSKFWCSIVIDISESWLQHKKFCRIFSFFLSSINLYPSLSLYLSLQVSLLCIPPYIPPCIPPSDEPTIIRWSKTGQKIALEQVKILNCQHL